MWSYHARKYSKDTICGHSSTMLENSNDTDHHRPHHHTHPCNTPPRATGKVPDAMDTPIMREHARPENGTIERAVGRPTHAVVRTGRISARLICSGSGAAHGTMFWSGRCERDADGHPDGAGGMLGRRTARSNVPWVDRPVRWPGRVAYQLARPLGIPSSPSIDILVRWVETGCRRTPRWRVGHALPENGMIDRAVDPPGRAVARTGCIRHPY